jgi:hypothetical protein
MPPQKKHHLIHSENDVLMTSPEHHQHDHSVSRDQRLERLIDRLPGYFQSAVLWSLRPSSRWVRVPAGVFLIGAGTLGFLPVFGFWMLPLGLVPLAEDFPPARWAAGRLLDWIERRWPQFFRGTSW